MTSQAWPSGEHPPRRQVAVVALRILLEAVVLFGAFALAPLDLRDEGAWVGPLAMSIALLAIVVVLQIVAVARSPYPGLRAIEALASSFLLLIVLFSALYYGMAQEDPGSFNESLNRVDAVYMTVTIFSTVGFGDLVATSQPGRIAVTVQMLVNMALIGVIVRVLLGTVQQRRAALSSAAPKTDAPENAEKPPVSADG